MKYTNPLQNLKIASPCSANWEEMLGNARRRYCGQCKLNVYNLSGMSAQEAEKLLLESEENLCVRFFQRADGTVITKDCPIGWQALKKRVSRVATAYVSILFGLLGGIGITELFSPNQAKPKIIVSPKTTSEDLTQLSVEPKRLHEFDRKKIKRLIEKLKKGEKKHKYKAVMGGVLKLELRKNTKKKFIKLNSTEDN